MTEGISFMPFCPVHGFANFLVTVNNVNVNVLLACRAREYFQSQLEPSDESREFFELKDPRDFVLNMLTVQHRASCSATPYARAAFLRQLVGLSAMLIGEAPVYAALCQSIWSCWDTNMNVALHRRRSSRSPGSHWAANIAIYSMDLPVKSRQPITVHNSNWAVHGLHAIGDHQRKPLLVAWGYDVAQRLWLLKESKRS